jgi:hypothetical protein
MMGNIVVDLVLCNRSFYWAKRVIFVFAVICVSAPGPIGCTDQPAESIHSEISCPARCAAPARLPATRAVHETARYWVDRGPGRGGSDAVLLGPRGVDRLNFALAKRGAAVALADLDAPLETDLLSKVNRRLRVLHTRLLHKKRRTARGTPLPGEIVKRFAPVDRLPPLIDEVRVALEEIPVRCGPCRCAFYKPDVDLRFDGNNCSTVRPQEPLRILAAWPGDLLLVRTRYTMGWISNAHRLSPPLRGELKERWLHGELYEASRPMTLQSPAGVEVALSLLTRLPAAGDGWVVFATANGFHRAPISGLYSTRRPLTWRALLDEAFSYLHFPYGWGGEKGGLDCSRLMMEIFAGFGLKLPRASGAQAKAGTFSIDLTTVSDESTRIALIEAAADHGVVLLHLPGHIMLYLGRNDDGRPMVLHSLAEYVAPCAGQTGDSDSEANGETLFEVSRVHVSDLELGRGGSRTALIERLDRIVVLGRPPGPELANIAQMRPGRPVVAHRRCPPQPSDTGRPGRPPIWLSPQWVHARRPLNLVISTSRHPGPAELALFDDTGGRVEVEQKNFGGPPYGFTARAAKLEPGWHTAVFGEGNRVFACRRFYVHRRPRRNASRRRRVSTSTQRARQGSTAARSSKGADQAGSAQLAWPVERRWNIHTENFYATWVEALFDYPLAETPTWPDLSRVLRDPRRNLLYDHFRRGEDAELYLRPDCADLPYYLRTYFAWRLRLPSGFRRCSRAHPQRPIFCEDFQGHYTSKTDRTALQTFRRFMRYMKGFVHSSCPRTPPHKNRTDFYPVPLRRKTLRPGVVFADPYGHTLVLTRWLAPSIDRLGVLIAVDAQPDGTVGLRRFWRGSFLFHPEKRLLGAGFKAFRPVRYNRRRELFWAPRNNRLRNRFLPFSLEQYEGSRDDFYTTMQTLINPLPLGTDQRLLQRVAALHELVQRRVVALRKGEDHLQEQDVFPIRMPHGGAIFQTTGDWERFATPARDLRLLIAIDVVTGFPTAVKAYPQRFGVSPARAEAEARRLRKRLAQALGARTFQYQKSDGSMQTLSLADLVTREKKLEMAYNPNDCLETRWGAPAGSAEAATCERHAPRRQRRRMQRYRHWFAQRRRPAR